MIDAAVRGPEQTPWTPPTLSPSINSNGAFSLQLSALSNVTCLLEASTNCLEQIKGLLPEWQFGKQWSGIVLHWNWRTRPNTNRVRP